MNPEIITIFATSVSAVATAIVAWATWKYTNYSKRNIEELQKQNQYLKEKDKADYVLERKKIGKNILVELNLNELLLNEIKEIFNSFKKLLSDDRLDDFYIKYKKRYEDGYLYNFNALYIENSFKKLLNTEIEFEDNELMFELGEFYNICKSTGRIIAFIDEKVNSTAGRKSINKLQVENDLIGCIDRLEDKVDRAFILADKLYEKFKVELGYDFKNSKYYRKLLNPYVISKSSQ